jgi:hypothetical protein
MTTEPTIDLDFDTRWTLARAGITQVDELICAWPNATPQETVAVVARLNITAVEILDTLQDIQAALAAIGHAIDTHPNPDIRNITISGQTLRTKGHP